MAWTYKERREKRRVYAFVVEGKLVGIYTNLRKLVKANKEKYNLPSYWTLSKKDKSKPIAITSLITIYVQNIL